MRALWSNLKTQSRVLGIMVGSMFVAALLFIAYYTWLYIDGAGRSTLLYIVMTLLYCALFGFMQLSGVYARTALAMGSTRRSIFWSRQIAKLVFGAVAPVPFFLLLALPRIVRTEQGPVTLSVQMYCLVLCTLVLVESIGSIFGIVAQRAGRFAIVLIIAFCILIGLGLGVAPILLAVVQTNPLDLGELLEKLSYLLSLGLFAAAVLISLLEARLSGKMTA